MAKSVVKQKKKQKQQQKKPAQVKSSPRNKRSGFFQLYIVHIIIIVILGLLVYSNTFHVPFVYDDASFIVGNPGIKDFHFFKNPLQALTIPSLTFNFRWQFITRILGNFTFALNYAVHGLNVTGYHVFNLVIHLINAILVYSLVLVTFRTPFFLAHYKLYDNPDGPHYHSVVALFSALIFVCHPVQIEAVTYISQRFTSLVATFYLLSLLLYAESRISESSASRAVLYVGAVVSAVCAMLTKENAFTLPVTIALYEFMFLEGEIRRRVLYLLPVMATMLIIPLLFLKAQGILADIRGIDKPRIGGLRAWSRWDYLITQFVVIVTYIRLLFLPVNQNLYYDFPHYRSFWEPPVFLSFLFLLVLFGCSVYLFFCSKRGDEKDGHELRLVSFGILWFFITLSVESSVMPLDNAIYEHRLYLPSAMLIVAFITLIFRVKNRIRKRLPLIEKAFIPASVMVVIVLSGAAYARNQVWQTGISLWEDVVKKSPYKAYAHGNLGDFYGKNGRLEEAIQEYRTTIKLDPNSVGAHTNLGVIYGKQGRFEEAEKELRTALTINPSFAVAHINMAVLDEKLGRTQEAIQELSTAATLDPYNTFAHIYLGVIYRKRGQLEEAEKELRVALKLRPDLTEVRRALQDIQAGSKKEFSRKR